MAERLESRNLLLTERGKKWLEQFAPVDRELAEKLVSSLTLVSHSEFERALQAILEDQVARREGPVSFYAVREVNTDECYFQQVVNHGTNQLNALAPGTDYGSEARIATLIRNYCKTNPENLLNHPTIEEMRSVKCRTIIFVDDFIGSGERTRQFIQSFWCCPTIASWHSLKYVNIIVGSYSGTVKGVKYVERHKAQVTVVMKRGCPTFTHMPWGKPLKGKISDLCYNYGRKTSKGWWWDGWGATMAALVFEHGCPDNAPALLWAPDDPGKPWIPLFPDRAILSSEKSVFPSEITRRDPITTLLDVGQKKLAQSGALQRRGELGEAILLILALIAQGQRKQIAMSFATGFDERSCAEIVERCIKWGFITRTRRLTEKGYAELRVAKKQRISRFYIPERGEEYYYPRQLRRATRG